MENSELEYIFDAAGWSDIYEKHQYKLLLTGLTENLHEDVLNAYFDAYSYEEAEAQCFDEMMYQLRMFKYIYEKNEFTLFPIN